MSCSCNSSDAILYACSGASNVGQIANDAAKALDQLGFGRMSCTIGVGAQLASFVKSAKEAAQCVAIDGCPVACARKALENAGVTPSAHVVVTELGIAKAHNFDYPREDVGKVASAVAEAMQHQASASDCGCGCSCGE